MQDGRQQNPACCCAPLRLQRNYSNDDFNMDPAATAIRTDVFGDPGRLAQVAARLCSQVRSEIVGLRIKDKSRLKVLLGP
jgi:hypothetical protein